MTVVSFVEYKHQETISVLRSVLRKALGGQIKGVALCVLTEDREDFAFTGTFKRDSARALKAANRISWKLNQHMDELEFAESGF